MTSSLLNELGTNPQTNRQDFHNSSPCCCQASCACVGLGAIVCVLQIHLSKLNNIVFKLLTLKTMVLIKASQPKHFAVVKVDVLHLCITISHLPTHPQGGFFIRGRGSTCFFFVPRPLACKCCIMAWSFCRNPMNQGSTVMSGFTS